MEFSMYTVVCDDSIVDVVRPSLRNLPNSTALISHKDYDRVSGLHIVIGGAESNKANIVPAVDFEDALKILYEQASAIDKCIIIGTSHIYLQALPYIRHLHVLTIKGHPGVLPMQLLDRVYMENTHPAVVYQGYSIISCTQTNYDYCKHESGYLDLLRELIMAPIRPNRTGIPTLGVFHRSLRFPLWDNGPILPLLTTKKTNFAFIFHELIWFLRGSTDISYLKEHKVYIWDGNSTREFLDSRKLIYYAPGEVGPIYGHQWVNWNAPYTPIAIRDDSDKPIGVNQIAEVINTLRTDPASRRMIVSAWNVGQLSQMALPPCFTGDTLVKSAAGYRPISDIHINDRVYNSQGEYEPVNEIHITKYTGDLIHLTIEGSHCDIKMTPNHEMYCNTDDSLGWKQAGDIRVGDQVGVSVNQTVNAGDPINWFAAGYYLMNKYSRLAKYGMMRRSGIIINHIEHPDVVKMIKEMKMKHIMSMKHIKCNQPNLYVFEPRHSIFVQIKHQQIIPQYLHDESKANITRFIEGIQVASGISDKIQIRSACLDFVLNLQMLLLKIGIQTQIQTDNIGYTVAGSMTQNEWTDLAKTGAIAWYDVIAVESKPVVNKPVYNLNVGNDHTYTVNNYITHNCHYSYQFHVDFEDGKPTRLNCIANMRSADVALGVPFNIASYALLTHMIAKLVNLQPGEVVISMADCHVYENHIDGIKKQLLRAPRRFPTIAFSPRLESKLTTSATMAEFIEDITIDDVTISDYNPHPYIKLEMAI